MKLKRLVYQQLLDWKKESNGKRALLIEGARRVGKSYIAEQFAQNEYKSYILIDFANVSKDVLTIFEEDGSNLDLFFTKLSFVFSKKLYNRETLFIFDEIQLFPKARQLIKYLVADGKYDYIETGSLISLKQNVKNILIPSEEECIQMYPLDFEEFLWAIGEKTKIPYIRTCFEQRTPLGQAAHRMMMNAFRQYLLVGGMPQAVITYVKTKDFALCDKVKRTILKLYRDDVTKFAKGYESKVLSIFDEIPSQLSKHEKRFTLASLQKNARLRTYEDAFMWLSEAMIVNTCYNSTDPCIGLNLNRDRLALKCYMGDTGLLVSHTIDENNVLNNDIYKALLLDRLSINEGMFLENYVAQALKFRNHKLYFYS
ncbi:MAG: AAA family ATPase, partial [Longicatena sp.]